MMEMSCEQSKQCLCGAALGKSSAEYEESHFHLLIENSTVGGLSAGE